MGETSISRGWGGKGMKVGWVGGSHIIHKFIGTCLEVMEGLKTKKKS